MEKFEKLTSLMTVAGLDAVKFYTKGNKAAGTRLRKTMLDIKTVAHDIRADVSKIKNQA